MSFESVGLHGLADAYIRGWNSMRWTYAHINSRYSESLKWPIHHNTAEWFFCVSFFEEKKFVRFNSLLLMIKRIKAQFRDNVLQVTELV